MSDDEARSLKLDKAWDNKAPHILVSYESHTPHRTVLAQSLTYAQGKRPNRLEVLVEGQDGKLHAGRVKVKRAELQGLTEEITEGRFDVMGRAYSTGPNRETIGLFPKEWSSTAHYSPPHNHIGRLVEYGVTWLEEHMQSRHAATRSIRGDRRLFATGKQELIHVFNDVEMARRHYLFRAFIECLDPNAVRFLKEKGLDYNNIYGWLAHNHRRFQAATALPGLLTALMRKDITATIDSEGLENPPPLIPVLRDKLLDRPKDIPPNIIKYLGRNPNVPLLLSEGDLGHAVGALECIDPSWYPSTPKEWEDFHLASNIAKVFSQTHGKDYKACMDDIRLLAVKGQPRWGSIKAGLYALGGNERVRDVGDWHQQVLFPCLEASLGALIAEEAGNFDNVARHELLAAAKDNAIANMTIQAQLAASNRYHEVECLNAYRLRLAGIELKKPMDVSQPTWHPVAAPMLHRHSADEQTFAFCVTDKEGLVTLADVQGHCVHGYDHSCITGRSHIVVLINQNVLRNLAEIPVTPPPNQAEIDVLEKSIPQGSYKHHAENQKLALMKWQASNYDRVKTFPDLWEQYVTEVQARGKRKDEGLADVTSDLLRLALDAAKYHNIPDLWKGISTVELTDDNAGNVTQRQHQGYPNRRGATPAEAAAIGAYRKQAEEQIDLNAIQTGRMAMVQAFPDRYRPYGQQQAPLIAFDWRKANQRNHIFQAARSLLASDADRNASNPLTWAKNRRLDVVLAEYLMKRDTFERERD